MRRATRRLLRIFPAVFVVALLTALSYPGLTRAAEKGNNSGTILVRRVNDGDTLSAVVDGRLEKIRLIGIDAPEIGQEPWGRAAKRHLEEMIQPSYRRVLIEYDVERRDKYGRLLAYVRTKDGRMVNREMLRDGYAVIFTLPPNVRYAGEFIEAERYARKRRMGIWSPQGIKEKPAVYRRQHPAFR